MKVIVVDDVRAEDLSAVLAELKGSQIRIAVSEKPLAVPASAKPVREKKVRGWSAKKWTPADSTLVRNFWGTTTNFFKDGRVRRQCLVPFARGLGRTPGAVVTHAWTLKVYKNTRKGKKAAVVVAPQMVPADRTKFRRWTPELREAFKTDYLGGMRVKAMARKYALTENGIFGQVHALKLHRRLGEIGKTNESVAVSSGVVRKAGDLWTPAVTDMFRKDYPVMDTKSLEKKYDACIAALAVKANRLRIRKDHTVATEHRKDGIKSAYMLRKKAMVPKPVFAGTIAPAGAIESQIDFPRLRGVNCRGEHIQRSFLSLAKREFKEIGYSGIGNFVLGISGFDAWDEFLSDAMMNFSLIAKVLGVPNRFRVGVQGEEKVIRYG
jgi:hypothetical protein